MFKRILIIVVLILFYWKLLVEFGGWFEPVSELHFKALSNVNGLNTLPNVTFLSELPFEESERENVCLSSYLRIGDEFVEEPDCPVICNTDGVEGRFVRQHEVVFVNGSKLSPGMYCLRAGSGICNNSTTLTLKTGSGWSCINRFAEFGGEGGNRILVCNGRLKDNLLNKTFEKFIPYNLAFSDINETLPNSKDYRFTCLKEYDSFYNNVMIESEWSRLDLIMNPCNRGITNAVDIKLDWKTGQCNCKEFNLAQSKKGYCIACKEGVGAGDYKQYYGLSKTFKVVDCDLLDQVDDWTTYVLKEFPCIDTNCYVAAIQTAPLEGSMSANMYHVVHST